MTILHIWIMNIMTLPKKGLKTGQYSMDMNKEDHIVTLPKKGLKNKTI